MLWNNEIQGLLVKPHIWFPAYCPGYRRRRGAEWELGERRITRIVGEMSAAGAHLEELSKRGPCPARAAVVC